MNKILPLIIILITGCSGYVQIYTVNSNDVKKVNNELFFENDTVKITYYFWAERGVFQFSVFNKLAKPLYIDWKKSAAIFKDLKFNYWFESEERVAFANYDAYRYNEKTLVMQGRIYERKEKEERITFIPPQSRCERWQYHIYKDGEFQLLHTGLEEKSFVGFYIDGQPVHVKGFGYTNVETDSLVKPEQSFRNFLTFSLSEDFSNEFYVNNTFFVKSIMELDDYDFINLTNNNNFEKNDKFYFTIPRELSVKYRKSYAGQ